MAKLKVGTPVKYWPNPFMPEDETLGTQDAKISKIHFAVYEKGTILRSAQVDVTFGDQTREKVSLAKEKGCSRSFTLVTE